MIIHLLVLNGRMATCDEINFSYSKMGGKYKIEDTFLKRTVFIETNLQCPIPHSGSSLEKV